MNRQYYSAKEVAEAMGVSEGKAYGIIRELNSQLRAEGYITVAGRVNCRYFEEKCLYGGISQPAAASG